MKQVLSQFPDAFRKHYDPLVDNPEQFYHILLTPPVTSFRVNTLKAKTDEVFSRLQQYGFEIQPVPWFEQAFTCNTVDMSFTLERFCGTVYTQELASMIPALILRDDLRQSTDSLTILDACAAPGSKTTLLAALMHNRGCLVANDKNYNRIRALKFNLNKCGAVNTCITNYDLIAFPKVQFDIVLLDAPCSADGTIRKSPDLLSRWSTKRLAGYASMQKDLIVRAFDLVKPGGKLVYSTCSMAPEENELVINHLLKKREASVVPVQLDNFTFSPAITQWKERTLHPDISSAARIFPHHNNTDGFFVAKVIK